MNHTISPNPPNLESSANTPLKFIKSNILFIFFILFSFVKFFLNLFIPTLFIYDEFLYVDQAHLISSNSLFSGLTDGKYPPIYPMLISLGYFVEFTISIMFNLDIPSPNISFITIKLINSFISTAIIFPMYLISKRYFSKDRAKLIGMLSSLFPSIFGYSFTFMSENIFYLVFFFYIYFTLKAIEEKSVKSVLISSFFLLICLFTRAFAFFFIPIWVFTVFKGGNFYSHLISKRFLAALTIILCAILGSLILIHQSIQVAITSYGSEMKGFDEVLSLYTSQINSVLSVIYSLIAYIIIGSGFIGFFGFIYLLITYKWRTKTATLRTYDFNENLDLLVIILFSFIIGTLIHILISTHLMDESARLAYLQNAILGRYLSPVFPLFLIIINFFYDDLRLIQKIRTNHPHHSISVPKKSFFVPAPISLFFLIYTPLPIFRVSDNLEFSLFNGILYLFPMLQFLLFLLIIVSPFFLALTFRYNFQITWISLHDIITCLLLLFIITNSAASFYIFHHRSNEENSFHQIGRWLSSKSVKNDTIWVDERDYNFDKRIRSDRLYTMFHVALGIEYWSENRVNVCDSSIVLRNHTYYFVSLYPDFPSSYQDFPSSILRIGLSPVLQVNITNDILEGVRSSLVNENNLTVFLFQYNGTASA